ncbi:MAG: maleylpyruvate isomerase N-terminal domain-containing protein [Rhodoglobus sp.]|nr:maleylpyruvate isomerase N-terminal domain-containing protein [Rhodoglobus sp.]
MLTVHDDRRADLARVSAAAVVEVSVARPGTTLGSPWWPETDRLIHHLGRHFGWVSSALRSTEEPPKASGPADGQPLTDWFSAQRDAYIELVNSVDPLQPVWTFVGPGTASFWFRRSIFEIGRHLWDLRTADGARPSAPAELSAERYADGVSEHFDIFLGRSRPGLEPLPGTLALVASDAPAQWAIHADWRVSDESPEGATVVTATAGDLALLCWERADPLAESGRFAVSGSAETLRAFTAAPIHR